VPVKICVAYDQPRKRHSAGACSDSDQQGQRDQAAAPAADHACGDDAAPLEGCPGE
jgi:hypothetical protein